MLSRLLFNQSAQFELITSKRAFSLKSKAGGNNSAKANYLISPAQQVLPLDEQYYGMRICAIGEANKS
ncbi:hypothetical protein OH492_04150 [Vibrio chagasii]|nr:hypothetical protein [Vibrio chagasii]